MDAAEGMAEMSTLAAHAQYTAVELGTGQSAPSRAGLAPWSANWPEVTTVEIPVGVVVVEHVFFCGKDLGLRFYVRPENVQRLLPENVQSVAPSGGVG